MVPDFRNYTYTYFLKEKYTLKIPESWKGNSLLEVRCGLGNFESLIPCLYGGR